MKNVWHLCKRILANTSALSECYAVFKSNHIQAFPLWCQAAGDNEEGLVQWVHNSHDFSQQPDQDRSIAGLSCYICTPWENLMLST